MRYNIYENGGAVNGLITIGGMVVTNFIKLRNDPVTLDEAVSKQYVDFLASSVKASGIISSTFSVTTLPAFSGQVTSVIGNNVLSLANTGVAPNTYSKVVIGTNGLVVNGSLITSSDIPALNWSKVVSNKPNSLGGFGITNGLTRTGGSVVGVLTANGDPGVAADVATKQYTDNKSGGDKVYVVGDLITGAYDVAPTGFLRCNGGEVSKTTYAALYAVIGDQFGSELVPGSGKPWKQQYSINTEQDGDITGWTTGTSLPGALSYSQAIVTKNRVYLLGGYYGGYLSTVYTAPINADGTLGAWTTGTSLPGVLGYSEAIVTKNRVHLLGGSNGNTGSTVYTAPINADGTLGAWTTGTSLPGVLTSSQAIVTKNRVYILGGSTSAVYTAPINADGTLGTWTTGTSLPGTLSTNQAIVTKNRVYVLVASTSTVYTAPISSDGTLGVWTTGTSLPGALSDSQAIVTKNRVYLLGGWAAGSVSTVYTAPINSDGTLGAWTTGTSLPVPLTGPQAIVTKNRVYLLAWNTSTVYTASFSGGLNDYSPYYDGTIETVINSNNFKLPNYISDKVPNGNIFVKF